MPSCRRATSVLASMTVRLDPFAFAIRRAVPSTARGVGRLVMMSFAALATRFGAGGDLDAGGLGFGPAVRVDVVADHLPAAGGKVARERAAHDAEADNADGAFHLATSMVTYPNPSSPVIPALVAGIQTSATAGARGEMDAGNKSRHDKSLRLVPVENLLAGPGDDAVVAEDVG